MCWIVFGTQIKMTWNNFLIQSVFMTSLKTKLLKINSLADTFQEAFRGCRGGEKCRAAVILLEGWHIVSIVLLYSTLISSTVGPMIPGEGCANFHYVWRTSACGDSTLHGKIGAPLQTYPPHCYLGLTILNNNRPLYALKDKKCLLTLASVLVFWPM